MEFQDFKEKMGVADSSGFVKSVYELLRKKEDVDKFQTMFEAFHEAGLDIYGTASGDQYLGIGRKSLGRRTSRAMGTLHIVGDQPVFEFNAENHKEKSWGKSLIDAYPNYSHGKNGFPGEIGIPYFSPRKNVNYFVFPLFNENFIKEITPLLIEDYLQGNPKARDGYWPVDYKSSGQNLEVAVSSQAILLKPKGSAKPKMVERTVSDYERDPKVKAWVLQHAGGECECCSATVPDLFIMDESKQPYLEVHHVVPLAKDGPDTPENAIAICPSCHRELHFGEDREELCDRLYQNIQRLERPPAM